MREAEIVEELAQHLEDRYDELVTGGASHEEAASAALAELSESDLMYDSTRRSRLEIKLGQKCLARQT